VIYNWSERAGYTGSSSDPREFISMDWWGIISLPARYSDEQFGRSAVQRTAQFDGEYLPEQQPFGLNHDAVRDEPNLGWGGFLVQVPPARARSPPAWLNQLSSSTIPAPAVPVTVEDPTVAYNNILGSRRRPALGARFG